MKPDNSIQRKTKGHSELLIVASMAIAILILVLGSELHSTKLRLTAAESRLELVRDGYQKIISSQKAGYETILANQKKGYTKIISDQEKGYKEIIAKQRQGFAEILDSRHPTYSQ
jgi:hypothetical protein